MLHLNSLAQLCTSWRIKCGSTATSRLLKFIGDEVFEQNVEGFLFMFYSNYGCMSVYLSVRPIRSPSSKMESHRKFKIKVVAHVTCNWRPHFELNVKVPGHQHENVKIVFGMYLS